LTTLLNTQPIFVADVSNGISNITNVVSTPNPGSDELVLLYQAGDFGALIESIQIHYLNWGTTEPANNLFIYTQRRNSNDNTERYCWNQTVIATNTETALLPTPISVVLPPILYGDSKRALKLSPGEKVFIALSVASTAGFNVIARGGQYG
jgi:hypothetical protein